MSAGACSAKMAEDRDKFFRKAASLGIDFVPVVGDFKSFVEADDWIDYTLAAVGTLPFAKVFTKPLKEAKLLLKAGDLEGANKLIKDASDAIPTKLPSSPISQSSSGVWKPDHGVEVNVGATIVSDSVAFSAKQLDKKFKHASDFGVITTKKNSDTIAEYQAAIKSHLDNKTTYEHGTYLLVPESKVFFNPQTNNVVVIDKSGNFVSGGKLDPQTKQYENFINNGTLR
ncbi:MULTISPECIES: colicin D domain-containing protein [Enterobacterales]|nr:MULTISPECIES: colicin D domain-containing protein [Enterobacterales]EMZ42918.1 hypothetical protein C827_02647 [Escherichia coli SWW33]MCK7563021.1 hypothetical protein [Citrobacter koseri]MDE8639859.1 colicin D domain-containing protein [Proteus mirabilis]MDY0870198.1 colicin D domain-containing protein [Klebsiella aerogenes]WOI98138.1 colicin D domain-containing protein [Citrobacter koseri]